MELYLHKGGVLFELEGVRRCVELALHRSELRCVKHPRLRRVGQRRLLVWFGWVGKRCVVCRSRVACLPW